MRRSLLLAGALLVGGRAAAAQVDTGAPRPPGPYRENDSTAAADTTARDTVEHLLPVFVPAIPPGPLPRGTRWSFDLDSLVFSNITTLSDLLAHVPGVYVARGGFFGAAEIAVYGGNGPVALELYWDGVPYLPLGRDSVWLDPARVPLVAVERVDVQLLPATLRVYLVSARQRSTVPSTLVRIATGGARIAQYRGAYARRWKSGLGLSLAAEDRVIDGLAGTSTTAFSDVDLWLEVQYVPSPHAGVAFQILSSGWGRAGEPSLVDPWKQHRTDQVLRAFLASRQDGLGARLTLTLARARASKDSAVPDRSLSQAILELSQTWSRASAGITARAQDAARPFQVEARASWQPLRFLTLAADARRSQYGAKGHGNRAHGAAGLALPLGFSLRGEASRFEDFQAPVVLPDSFQWASDYAGYLRWDRSWITLEAGEVQRDAFRPIGFGAGILPVASLGSVPKSTYASAHLSVRPVAGLQLSGWYFDPIKGGGDFEPPTHGRYSATFYSKFWRVYKSGVFALRAEVATEAWSRSNLGGLDSSGSQLALGPATFVELNVQVRIAGFTGYWVMRNYTGMRGSYVTGLDYPKYVQYYGVEWFFSN